MRETFDSIEACPYTWLTPKELAYCLRPCDVRTLLRMIHLGTLHGYRVGRSWRIPIASARSAFPSQRTNVARGTSVGSI